MPSADRILLQMAAAAWSARTIAIAWHAVFAFAVALLFAGWAPTRRHAAQLLALPLLSVAGVAFVYGNPFNGMVFTALGVALLALARRAPEGSVERAPRPLAALGGVLALVGFVYPHFLEGQPLATYLYAAPLGIVPCATLYAVIGLSLIGGAFRARAWSLVLGAVGLFYGVFGVFRLGVRLDLGLIVGAVALLAISLKLPHARRARGVTAS